MPEVTVLVDRSLRSSISVFVPPRSNVGAVKRALQSLPSTRFAVDGEFSLAAPDNYPTPLPDGTLLGTELLSLVVVPKQKPSPSPSKKIKIALLCWGSRGDVQPVVAVALQLKALGVSPTLFVNDDEGMRLGEFMRSFSLEVETYPHICPFNATEIMDGIEGTHELPDVDTGPEEVDIFRKLRRIKPDLVVLPGRLWLIGWVVEKLLSICTVEFTFHREGSYSNLTRDRMERMFKNAPRMSSVLGVRKAELDFDSRKVVVGGDGSHRPVLYAVSPELGVSEPEWPVPTETSGIHMTGFWTLPEQLQHGASFGSAQEKELNHFIAGASDVIYLGWGSMHVRSNEFMVLLAVRTLKLLNCRGIILGSYSELSRDSLYGEKDSLELVRYAAKNILWLRWASHEWLMPRCQVIVQHGGCGTTAAAMRSGRPTVVTPTGFDQFYWGDRVQQVGVGVRTEHLSKLTPQDLAAAVRTCQTQKIQKQAAALGEKLRAEEPGAAQAAKFLKEYVHNTVVPGKWAQQSTSRPGGVELPEGKNLALGQPARASSSKSAEKAPSMAVDGQPFTRWTSAYENKQWLAVDLGALHTISRVVINWEAAYARSYEVQGSLDGESWFTLASEQGREGYVQSKLKPGCKTRWVRMFGNTRATKFGFSIWELNVYE